MRTPDASDWQSHEDQILYNNITDTLMFNQSISNAYKLTTHYFKEEESCTTRTHDAIRQRWSKLKKDPIQMEEMKKRKAEGYMVENPYPSDSPVTTGVQVELDFDEPEEVPVFQHTTFARIEEPEVDTPVNPFEVVFTDVVSGMTEILSQVVALQEENRLLQEENQELHEALDRKDETLVSASRSYEKLMRETKEKLAHYSQIKKMFETSAS